MKKNLRSQLIQHHVWQIIARADAWLTLQDIIGESHDYAELARQDLDWRDFIKAPFVGAAGRFSLLPPQLTPGEISTAINELVLTRDYVVPVSVTEANLTEVWNERFAQLPTALRELNALQDKARFWGTQVYPEYLPEALHEVYTSFRARAAADEVFPLNDYIEAEKYFNLQEQQTGDQLMLRFQDLLREDPASPELVVYHTALPFPDEVGYNQKLARELQLEMLGAGVFPPRPLPEPNSFMATVWRRNQKLASGTPAP